MLLLVGMAARNTAAQQDADAYFHEAAQHYVEDDRTAARRAVEKGLQLDPSDARLRALRKKLSELERRERSSDSSGGSRQSGRSDETETDGESPSSDSEQRAQSESGRRESSAAKGARQDPTSTRSERNGPENRAPISGEVRSQHGLTRTQAEQLLGALELQEKRLLRSLQRRESEASRVEKDW